jgi:hypothetical protein
MLATLEKELFYDRTTSSFEQGDPVSGYDFQVHAGGGEIPGMQTEHLLMDSESAGSLHLAQIRKHAPGEALIVVLVAQIIRERKEHLPQ